MQLVEADNLESIPQLLAQRATDLDQKSFVIDGPITLSYQDMLHQAHAMGAWLISRGCHYGDRIGIWAPNCAQWIVAALGTQLIGGTLVTLNTRYKGSEAAEILNQSGCRWLFCVDNFLGVDYPVQLESQSIPALEDVITLTVHDQNDYFHHCLREGEKLLGDADHADALAAAEARVCGNTTSDILFTSGTTGRPKGVVTAHRQNLKAFSEFARILGLASTDRYLIINPFFHSFGYKAGWLATLIAGATAYPLALFDVPEVMAQVERNAINVMPGPPTLFRSIMDHPDFDASRLASLQKATTGAAVIPTTLVEDMWQTLGLETVITAYGLSETCGLVTMCRQGDTAETIATTSGRAIPDVELAIVDSDNRPVPAGQTGEIVVRGFNVMQGYFNNPEATAETIDPEGWLHTGDIGHLDEDGNVSITDRLKDMYISGGFNCYPAEIEQQLLTHPSIAQAAVVGMPDERLGEVGAAFLIPQSQTEQTSRVADEELIAWCRTTMANYKVPRKIVWVDNLPLNATGKVMKQELRKRLD
ncbi:MAG: FadD3 family acyl-CoA ligase [Halieaceae bacterium]|jgi:acyl-CoA synthetase (AMP-forming)/AMP-acid ligase II